MTKENVENYFLLRRSNSFQCTVKKTFLRQIFKGKKKCPQAPVGQKDSSMEKWNSTI